MTKEKQIRAIFDFERKSFLDFHANKQHILAIYVEVKYRLMIKNTLTTRKSISFRWWMICRKWIYHCSQQSFLNDII